ncbi:hypothetical protein PG995_015826 [Apiospora arundinis]
MLLGDSAWVTASISRNRPRVAPEWLILKPGRGYLVSTRHSEARRPKDFDREKAECI